ncbi:hypothetical protein BC828DRAFT_374557 [Blastocladiella britannica]|nr:hypothetical protein BC828DRAFT_374557 [Blastocladiella britannica]
MSPRRCQLFLQQQRHLTRLLTTSSSKNHIKRMDPLNGLDIRVARILSADPFPEARKPAIKLRLDVGPEIGEKKSSAQIVANHGSTDEQRAELVGSLVLCVLGLPRRQIGKFMSEVLVLGVPDQDGNVVLIRPDPAKDGVVVGGRLY